MKFEMTMDEERQYHQTLRYFCDTKEEGKREYAKFLKEFTSSARKLRYVLESGGIESMMGHHPGPRPISPTLHKEWREDMREVEEDCTTALSLLLKCFPCGTTPAHIIDKTCKFISYDLSIYQWTCRN